MEAESQCRRDCAVVIKFLERGETSWHGIKVGVTPALIHKLAN